jgi:hypothetical protein
MVVYTRKILGEISQAHDVLLSFPDLPTQAKACDYRQYKFKKIGRTVRIMDGAA